MIPIQEIQIKTRKGAVFNVLLQKLTDTNFQCLISVIRPGPTLPIDAEFRLLSKGRTANDAFTDLVSELSQSLSHYDPDDVIVEINNPCNTNFFN